jgi:biopolymer transport protein ExbB
MRALIISLILQGAVFADSKDSSTTKAQTSYVQNVEKKVITIDLKNAFDASPVIYSILLGLSMASLTVALSAYFEMSKKLYIPQPVLDRAKEKIITCRFDEAHEVLEKQTEAIAYMLMGVIDTRKYGLINMKEAMKLAGKRQTQGCWQKISLLSDIALLAPMIGLLGTVLGMFYAFYDVNRSIESLASLFDGLGVSVGTTVAGLLVALFSMGFQTILKHRLMSKSCKVELACETITNYIGQS